MSTEPESERQPFRAVTNGRDNYLIVRVDDETAQRTAMLLAEGESPLSLALLVADAVNLRAMPTLLAKAKL